VKPQGDEGILTLEPLIDAVREGVEGGGWELSGLQKTTSHQFEGRWEGEATRSAYLFFHLPDGPDHVSVDVYLDETGRGLTGNLALVVDLVPLGDLEGAEEALRTLGRLSGSEIGEGFRRPVTLRFRLADASDDPAQAETEVRFKVRIPKRTIREGPVAVSGLAVEAIAAFSRILASEAVAALAPREEDGVSE
jgi:hypothetical protein